MSWTRPGLATPLPQQRRVPVNVPVILALAYGMAATIATLVVLTIRNLIA